ncbi:DUF6765 family protein [Magnetofaba australis]|uniref:Uncharacterized protein n=1 Tax=Magnetofaba australis IT-1 TaxID=1434232 RepID=A0A1Y2K0E2_9PROT|nr:DUF6765 family protein [Magnetofaba australis]OSM01491.1 hypothetical protein MAIT1_01471 [Magnetofaba australis IT-1]
MQIDFHHTVTYVAARLASYQGKKFSTQEAEIIAKSAQYVDDATGSGAVNFGNGAMIQRHASAHRMMDYRNFKELKNHQVWIPFHFLPGNDGQEKSQASELKFFEKIVCKPDSPVARDMVAECIRERDKPFALYRLGITMHVYADTFSHQQFAGVSHQYNEIFDVVCENDEPPTSFKERLSNFFKGAVDEITSTFVEETLPLGHGAALSYPDLPYLKWQYTRKDIDGNSVQIERDNTDLFLSAVIAMHKAMSRFLAGDPIAEVEPISQSNLDAIRALFLHEDTRTRDADGRHAVWLNRLASGNYFEGIDAVELTYHGDGRKAWKYEAIGSPLMSNGEQDYYKWKQEILTSHWKLFHDALLAHRFHIIHELLPEYGICVA